MLTQPSPSWITTRTVCIVCDCQMLLTLVEPAYDGKRVDNHTFRCDSCGLTQTYPFDRGSASGPPQFGLGRLDRHADQSSRDCPRPEGDRVPMERFVIHRNVAHYRDLLQGRTTEAQRKQVMKLLAEEEAKLQQTEPI